MKIFINIVVILLTYPVFAAQIICQSHPKDVRVEVSWLEKEIQVRVVSPLGYDYMPLIEGPVRPSSLNWNRYQIEQLQTLGSRFEVSFAKDQCVWTVNKNKSDTRLECNGPSFQAPKDLLFTSFTLTRMTESTMKNQYSTRRFRMAVVKTGEFGTDTFFVTIPVVETGCLDYE